MVGSMTDMDVVRQVSAQVGEAKAQLDKLGGEQTWTIGQLRDGIDRWEAELRAGGYPESTISTHTNHPRQFVRWLEGTWQPTGPRAR